MSQTKKNRPQFYGLIKTGTYPNNVEIGKLAIWQQFVEPNTKQPPFKGNVTINGQKYYVAVWQNLEE